VFINEIYSNPPDSEDTIENGIEAIGEEYIELRGTPGQSLANHYLIFLENEGSPTAGTPGKIDNIFNLGNKSLGSNGYALFLMTGSPYPAAAPGTNVYQNTNGFGYGTGAGSTIGHSGENVEIEGSGFTALLLNVDTSVPGTSAPALDALLDTDRNGVLDTWNAGNGRAGWSVVDSVGLIGETSELGGFVYGNVNFGPGVAANLPSGTVYVNTTANPPSFNEIEYVGRWGDSSGFGADSWMAANLTDNANSGYTPTLRNFGVSGTHSSQTNPELYHGFVSGAVPYGTDVPTLGALNIPEPASLGLFVIAGVGMMLTGGRRRRGC
jgi:hypothetical protein